MQGEPARVELPSLLGSFPHAHAAGEFQVKPSPWLFEVQQENTTTYTGMSGDAVADRQEVCGAGAGKEASVHLLPECLAEDVFDEMPSQLDIPAGSWDAELGSLDMPTIGSANHATGMCKPCAFVTTKGCKDGIECKFCHLCEPGEKKRRKKQKRAFMSAVKRIQMRGVA
jgi:hypothetical protein